MLSRFPSLSLLALRGEVPQGYTPDHPRPPEATLRNKRGWSQWLVAVSVVVVRIMRWFSVEPTPPLSVRERIHIGQIPHERKAAGTKKLKRPAGQSYDEAQPIGAGGATALRNTASCSYGRERHFAISHGRRVLPVHVEHPPHDFYRIRNFRFVQQLQARQAEFSGNIGVFHAPTEEVFRGGLFPQVVFWKQVATIGLPNCPEIYFFVDSVFRWRLRF